MAKTKTIENLFTFLDELSCLLPIFFLAKYWKASYPEVGLRILAVYSSLTFLINILFWFNPSSLVLFELFTIIEAAAFFGFLFIQIKNETAKKAVLIAGVAFILFSALHTFLNKDSNSIDSVPIGVETILILLFSFTFLFEKTKDTTTLYIYSAFPFWVVIGMVLYLSGCFFIYIFASSLPQDDVRKYWFVTNIFSIVKNIFFAIAIIVHSKPSKKLPSGLDFNSLN